MNRETQKSDRVKIQTINTKQTFEGTAQLQNKLYVYYAQRRCRCCCGLIHQRESLWEGNRRGIRAAPVVLEFRFRVVSCRWNCRKGTRRNLCLLEDIRRGQTGGTAIWSTA